MAVGYIYRNVELGIADIVLTIGVTPTSVDIHGTEEVACVYASALTTAQKNRLDAIMQENGYNYARTENPYVTGDYMTLISPNGSTYRVTVSNSGTISALKI